MRACTSALLVSLGVVMGCQQSPAVDAAMVAEDSPTGIDVPEEVPDAFVPVLDAIERPDTPRYVDGARVYLDGETRPDAFDDYDGGTLCGFDAAADSFVCGGSDPWPSDCESPTNCCHGVCDPFGTDQVCCNTTTGTITVYRYMSGMCPLYETTSCG